MHTTLKRVHHREDKNVNTYGYYGKTTQVVSKDYRNVGMSNTQIQEKGISLKE